MTPALRDPQGCAASLDLTAAQALPERWAFLAFQAPLALLAPASAALLCERAQLAAALVVAAPSRPPAPPSCADPRMMERAQLPLPGYTYPPIPLGTALLLPCGGAGLPAAPVRWHRVPPRPVFDLSPRPFVSGCIHPSPLQAG